MANFTPLCGNACLQSPTGERGEATKREVLFVATDCAGERARLWVAERAQTPFQTPYLDSVLIPNSCPQNCSHEHLEPEIESHDVNCLHTSIPKVIISWITANHFPNHHKIPCPLWWFHQKLTKSTFCPFWVRKTPKTLATGCYVSWKQDCTRHTHDWAFNEKRCFLKFSRFETRPWNSSNRVNWVGPVYDNTAVTLK